ncbi:AEC family transporter [Solicola gregarius]|uniref:AEC family transporter n=1 Tax=Solicola gregarius TaxID=2908642 RepID=A0AA46TDX9_9ACTN|nr:AEC family transporter [Solicola gregarius]UYM03526.1 AEC family transporter [Solicola gregarius]
MGGVLEGFGVIGVVIGVGFLVAHLGIIGAESQLLLARLVFFVASPALLFSVLSDVDAVAVLSSRLVVAVVSFVVVAVIAATFARLVWHMSRGDATIATLCAAYVNSGNLGIPIAVYALDDASAVASVMLFQMLIVSPVAFLLLDQDRAGRRLSVFKVVTIPFRNPITVGSLLGLLVAITGWQLPSAVVDPIDMIAGMAVPGMLIAYGVSLRLGPRPGNGAPSQQVAVATVLKLVLQPACAYGCGLLLGLEGNALMAVTVVAALPTAHNIFVHATRYGRSQLLARDSIFVTTILSVPVVLLIVAALA